MIIATPCKLIGDDTFNAYEKIDYHVVNNTNPTVEVKILTFECHELYGREFLQHKQLCIFWKEAHLFMWLPYKEFIFYKSYLIFEPSNFVLLKFSDGAFTVTTPLYKCSSIQEGINYVYRMLNDKCNKDCYPERFMGIHIGGYSYYNMPNPEQYFLDCPASGSKIVCSIYTHLASYEETHMIGHLPYTHTMSCPPYWDDWDNWFGHPKPPVPTLHMKRLKKIKDHWFIWADTPYARRILCLDRNFEYVKGCPVKKYSAQKRIEDINKLSERIKTSEKDTETYLELLKQRSLRYYCRAKFGEAIADVTKVIERTPNSSYIYRWRAFLHNMNKQRDASRRDIQIADTLDTSED